MVSRFSAYTPQTAAEQLLAEASDVGPVYAVNQPAIAIRAVLLAADEMEDPPEIRLVCERSPLTATRETFPLAARAASLVAADTLTARAHEQLRAAPVFVTSEGVRTLMAIDGFGAHGGRTGGEYVDAMGELAPTLWEAAEPFEFTAPPLDCVMEAARERDETLAAAFADCVEVAIDEEQPFDAVATALVLGAEEELLYARIREWLTDTGIASATTVSRRKHTLEHAGFLTTRSVETEDGRPRQRLAFTDRGVRQFSWPEFPEMLERVVKAIE